MSVPTALFLTAVLLRGMPCAAQTPPGMDPELKQELGKMRSLVEQLHRLQVESAGQTTPEIQDTLKQISDLQRKARRRELESLKESDPEAYASQQEAFERQEKIDKVLDSWRAKGLSRSEAEKKLIPLVRPDVVPQAAHVQQQIDLLEAQIKRLKEIQKDPDLLVRERVSQLLDHQ